MGFVNQDVLRRVLSQRPCPLLIIYWGQDRVTAREALHLLTTLDGSERLLMLGRFAYVEAPPPGQPERRSESGAPPAVASPLRLADLWTVPDYAGELETRVLQAMDASSLSTPSQSLLARTLMPRRTLEAMCFALEEKGLVQVVPRGGTEDDSPAGDFVVLRSPPPSSD